MAGLTPSQIAAQAAMHMQNQQHTRQRSQTLPDPSAPVPTPPQSGRQTPASPAQKPAPNMPSNPNLRNYDGFIGGHTLAAQTAASAVFPRSPGQASPNLAPERLPPPMPEKDVRKEKSKMKLFHKPKSIGIHKDKDVDRKHTALPSPNKSILTSGGTLVKLQNASTTSLVDTGMSSASSLYSSNNASTSTLVPSTYEKEKEKKHHFLSRQKNKLKDDHFNLPLSSASSTSKPTDPNAPQPLYSFAAPPSSPSHSTFAKSVSGLDLRHGARALREKKKEEKSSSLGPVISTNLEPPFRGREDSFSNSPDWPSQPSFSSTTLFGPASNTSDQSKYTITQTGVSNPGAVWGVTSISPDDAWHYVKANALKIFEGSVPRPPIEDFNDLVSTEVKRCIRLRQPLTMIEELNELLQVGFTSLEYMLRSVPDTQLIPHLVQLWDLVFSTVLPFMQAVFLPLDLEFKGRGPLMSAREAAEFWGAALPSSDDAAANKNIPTLGEDIDIRRITLLTFRDVVILPRHDALMAIFSRLSLESINAGVTSSDSLPEPPPLGGSRPGTATSSDSHPNSTPQPHSFNSQTSTLLDTASPFTNVSRSRATSNTSAGSFGSGPNVATPPLQTQNSNTTNPNLWADSSKVTDMVGKMLQCVSVVASVQSGDEAQSLMEGLTKALKYNWLGRGRTGRQRRGFVGMRVGRPPVAGLLGSGGEGVGVAG
jgi:hypothetical protein